MQLFGEYDHDIKYWIEEFPVVNITIGKSVNILFRMWQKRGKHYLDTHKGINGHLFYLNEIFVIVDS